jgi:hypothetical protein
VAQACGGTRERADGLGGAADKLGCWPPADVRKLRI